MQEAVDGRYCGSPPFDLDMVEALEVAVNV